MSTPLILLIQQAILTRLETISVTNDFNTNAGSSVELGQRSFDELESGEVVLTVFRGKNAVHEGSFPMQDCGLPVVIEGHFGVATDAASEAERILADIKQAALQDRDRILGGLLYKGGLRLLSDEVFYPQPGSTLGQVRVILKADYTELYGDPCTLPDDD
jgi:hypothetical protein